MTNTMNLTHEAAKLAAADLVELLATENAQRLSPETLTTYFENRQQVRAIELATAIARAAAAK